METVKREKISVRPSSLQPLMHSIGFCNVRYNSMMVKHGLTLVSCGSFIRMLSQKGDILLNKQIGHSQIFQILPCLDFILVVNFDGLISLLSFPDLDIMHQFHTIGKEIRHCAASFKEIAFSCELNEGTEECIVEIYSLKDVVQKKYVAKNTIQGYYYYPEIVEETLVLINYYDPNPKGKPRKETVLNKKLPIINSVSKFHEGKEIFNHKLEIENEIICATQNKGIIYYLHCNKQMTIYNILDNTITSIQLKCASIPLLVENYLEGVILAESSQTLLYLHEGLTEIIKFKTEAIGGNLSLKIHYKEKDIECIVGYNESGLHFYDLKTEKTISHNMFNITNCGVSICGDKFAVGDFCGSVNIFHVDSDAIAAPLETFQVGVPVRSIVLLPHKIIIGCVGGSLFVGSNCEVALVEQLPHSINIIRCNPTFTKIFIGTSMGEVRIYDVESMKLVQSFIAHFPVNYEDEESRELFGSMKNYAEIWSMTLCPTDERILVTSSEDQSERVFALENEAKELKMFKEHKLAVTSLDWKQMKQGIIYASCSDDKVLRLRNKELEILAEIETTTIKEWHTLTYLCLEENGTRVAVGSQNGFLFIYDVFSHELLFADKIHLGGIEGMDWKNGRIITCSSDLCINVVYL